MRKGRILKNGFENVESGKDILKIQGTERKKVSSHQRLLGESKPGRGVFEKKRTMTPSLQLLGAKKEKTAKSSGAKTEPRRKAGLLVTALIEEEEEEASDRNVKEGERGGASVNGLRFYKWRERDVKWARLLDSSWLAEEKVIKREDNEAEEIVHEPLALKKKSDRSSMGQEAKNSEEGEGASLYLKGGPTEREQLYGKGQRKEIMKGVREQIQLSKTSRALGCDSL